MNIRNYHKYFTVWNVKTSTTHKDKFGGVAVGVDNRTIKGYLSKSNTNTRDESNIPQTVSGGILFTDPDVLLHTGDIINDKYQIIDFDAHSSHVEYSVKLLDKWGDLAHAPTPPIDLKSQLMEDAEEMLYEDNVYMKLEGA